MTNAFNAVARRYLEVAGTEDPRPGDITEEGELRGEGRRRQRRVDNLNQVSDRWRREFERAQVRLNQAEMRRLEVSLDELVRWFGRARQLTERGETILILIIKTTPMVD